MLEELFFTIKMLLNTLTYKEWLLFCSGSDSRDKKRKELALKAMSRFENEFATFEKCQKAYEYMDELDEIKKILLEGSMTRLAKTFNEWEYIFLGAKELCLKSIVELSLDNMTKLADNVDSWTFIYLVSDENTLIENLAKQKLKEFVCSFEEWQDLSNKDKRKLKEFSFCEMYRSAKTFDEWFIVYRILRNSRREEEKSVAFFKMMELMQFKDLLTLTAYSSSMTEFEEFIINKILDSEFTQEQIVSLYDKCGKDSKVEKFLLSTKLCCRRK